MSLNRILSNHWLLLSYMITIIIMLYLRDVSGYDINKMYFVYLVLIVSLCCKMSNLFSLIAFTLPFMCGLPGNYFLPIWTLRIVIQIFKKKNIYDINVIYFMIVITIYEILHILYYPYQINLLTLCGYLCSFTIVATMSANDFSIDFSKPTLSFCIGSSVFLCIMYLIYKSNPSMMLLEGGIRMGGDSIKEEDVMILATNANYVALYSIASLACLLSLFHYKKIRANIFIPLFLISLFCGMFSVSRTWMVLVPFMFLYYLFMNHKKQNYGYIIFVLLIAFIVYFIQSNKEYIYMFVNRFNGDSVDGGRIYIISTYYDYLSEHIGMFIFGTGCLIYPDVIKINFSIHNALQQIWVCYGIIGLTFILGAFLKNIRRYYVTKEYMAVLPMISVFIFLQTIQVLSPYYCMYPLIPAFLIMKMVKQDYNH